MAVRGPKPIACSAAIPGSPGAASSGHGRRGIHTSAATVAVLPEAEEVTSRSSRRI